VWTKEKVKAEFDGKPGFTLFDLHDKPYHVLREGETFEDLVEEHNAVYDLRDELTLAHWVCIRKRDWEGVWEIEAHLRNLYDQYEIYFEGA
jgi:hypothetical protein